MTERHFRFEPDPDNPGWSTWEVVDRSCFNVQLEPMLVRRDPDGRGRVRITPRPEHRNIAGVMHGGMLMAFVDVALFAGCQLQTESPMALTMTVDCSIQFVRGVAIGQPLDAVVELVRETGRMLFVRGLVEQDGEIAATFSGLLRKSGRS